jgi:hypothetical protein
MEAQLDHSDDTSFASIAKRATDWIYGYSARVIKMLSISQTKSEGCHFKSVQIIINQKSTVDRLTSWTYQRGHISNRRLPRITRTFYRIAQYFAQPYIFSNDYKDLTARLFN